MEMKLEKIKLKEASPEHEEKKAIDSDQELEDVLNQLLDEKMSSQKSGPEDPNEI